MPRFYEKAIYQELGEDIGKELKKNHCEIIVNHENVTYAFSNCPDSLLKKIIKVKKSNGEGSILNEFCPNLVMDRTKWKMSEKDRNCFIKSFHDYETTFDLLIMEQKITYEKLLKELEALQDKVTGFPFLQGLPKGTPAVYSISCYLRVLCEIDTEET